MVRFIWVGKISLCGEGSETILNKTRDTKTEMSPLLTLKSVRSLNIYKNRKKQTYKLCYNRLK